MTSSTRILIINRNIVIIILLIVLDKYLKNGNHNSLNDTLETPNFPEYFREVAGWSDLILHCISYACNEYLHKLFNLLNR